MSVSLSTRYWISFSSPREISFTFCLSFCLPFLNSVFSSTVQEIKPVTFLKPLEIRSSLNQSKWKKHSWRGRQEVFKRSRRITPELHLLLSGLLSSNIMRSIFCFRRGTWRLQSRPLPVLLLSKNSFVTFTQSNLPYYSDETPWSTTKCTLQFGPSGEPGKVRISVPEWWVSLFRSEKFDRYDKESW